MIKLAGLGNNIEENKEKMLKQIYNRQAFNKFKEMVKIQGGDTSYLENTEKFKTAKYKTDIISNRSGKIKEIPADIIAKYVCNLGAGRVKKEDKIDMAVGIILSKKNGDSIKEGEKILTIHSNKKIEDANLETFKILIE